MKRRVDDEHQIPRLENRLNPGSRRRHHFDLSEVEKSSQGDQRIGTEAVGLNGPGVEPADLELDDDRLRDGVPRNRLHRHGRAKTEKMTEQDHHGRTRSIVERTGAVWRSDSGAMSVRSLASSSVRR